jgi:hypothetical protein
MLPAAVMRKFCLYIYLIICCALIITMLPNLVSNWIALKLFG